MTAPVVTDTAEAQTLTRVLSALLREDVVGLRSRSTLVHRPDGPWLRLPTGETDALLLPVTEDGFQAEYGARLPLLARELDGSHLTSYDTVLAALREHADPADRAGFDAFPEECRQTLATMRLHDETREEVHERLGSEWGGLGGGLAYDTLAARLDHPVYPTRAAAPDSPRHNCGRTHRSSTRASRCAGSLFPERPSPSPGSFRTAGRRPPFSA